VVFAVEHLQARTFQRFAKDLLMHQWEAMNLKYVGTIVAAEHAMNVSKIRNNDDYQSAGSGQICVLLDD